MKMIRKQLYVIILILFAYCTIITPTTISENTVGENTCLNNFLTELASLPSRFLELEAKSVVLDLQLKKLETISTQLDIRTSQLEIKSAQVDATLTELTKLVNDIRAMAITNIRLGELQTTNVYGDAGYEDSYGFVLTSAGNFNKDQYLDYVRRRKIEKFVNGQWVSI